MGVLVGRALTVENFLFQGMSAELAEPPMSVEELEPVMPAILAHKDVLKVAQNMSKYADTLSMRRQKSNAIETAATGPVSRDRTLVNGEHQGSPCAAPDPQRAVTDQQDDLALAWVQTREENAF